MDLSKAKCNCGFVVLADGGSAENNIPLLERFYRVDTGQESCLCPKCGQVLADLKKEDQDKGAASDQVSQFELP